MTICYLFLIWQAGWVLYDQRFGVSVNSKYSNSVEKEFLMGILETFRVNEKK